MPWVKLTDKLDESEKLAAISDASFRLWVLSIAYANRKLTDGHVPASRARILTALRVPEKTIAELVEAKLWHRASAPCASCVRQREAVKADAIPSGGYVIHHYFGDPQTGERYQKARWVVEQERERLRLAGRTGGQKSGMTRSSQVKHPASAADHAAEADSFSPQVKLTGEAPSFTPAGEAPSFDPHAQESKHAASPRTPYPRRPVPQSDSSTYPGGAGGPEDPGDPPIPDVPEQPDRPQGTARRSSQGRGGLRHVGEVMGGARG